MKDIAQMKEYARIEEEKEEKRKREIEAREKIIQVRLNAMKESIKVDESA